MREIKFRGLRADGIWEYGDLYTVPEKGWTLIRNRVDGERFFVSPETVGQYTGLLDADGREIYEGDIIKLRTQNPYWRFRRNFVVTWGTDGWLLDGDSLYSWFSFHTLEIIGNVHDNPELLEADHERD